MLIYSPDLKKYCLIDLMIATGFMYEKYNREIIKGIKITTQVFI